MNNKDEFIDINDIDIINQYDKNENMGNMNMNYQNSNMNTANSNMGYQNNSMNMGNMNMNYQNSNMNMANSNMGYQNNSMNMGNMNMNYQNSNMNIAHIDSNRGVVQQEEVSFQNMTAYKQRLRSMKEVQALTSEIEIDNSNSILMFGQQASESISKISDELLNSMKAVKSEEAGEMLVSLTKIMDKFDIKELENVKENSIVSKLFKNLGNSVAKLFQKYDTMGYEVEKVYILLKKYENDIKESNANLKKLYNGNLNYYKELEKFNQLVSHYCDEVVFYYPCGYAGQKLDSLQERCDLSNLSIKSFEIKHTIPCAVLWNSINVTCEGYLSLCCSESDNRLIVEDINHMGDQL